MGSCVCKKCGIPENSHCIIDNNNRRHCRFHSEQVKKRKNLLCMDCNEFNGLRNCRHKFVFKFYCNQ